MKTQRARRYAGLAIIVCCLVIAAATFGTYFLIPASLHYHITEYYRISELSENSNIYLGILIPVTRPYQTIESVQIEWAGDISRDIHDSGETIKMDALNYPGDVITAIVSYDVILVRGNINWKAPVGAMHTEPQYGIESDNLEINAMASNITSGNNLDDVKSIFMFVANNIEYYPMEDNWAMSSAFDTYKSRAGVCTGIARLMVALCRASEIPSKMVHGIVIPDMFFWGSIEESTPHAWVEFYSEGEWGIADPTWGSGLYGDLHFNRSDGLHLSYGEFDQERWDFMDLAYWAVSSGNLISMENGYYKYVASAGSQDAKIEVRKVIRKGWDSRWILVLLAWGSTTAISIWIRNHYLMPKGSGDARKDENGEKRPNQQTETP